MFKWIKEIQIEKWCQRIKILIEISCVWISCDGFMTGGLNLAVTRQYAASKRREPRVRH